MKGVPFTEVFVPALGVATGAGDSYDKNKRNSLCFFHILQFVINNRYHPC